jgi:hypothetical protein
LDACSNMDMDVTTLHNGVGVRRVQHLERCHGRNKRSLAANAWRFVLLNLINGLGKPA